MAAVDDASTHEQDGTAESPQRRPPPNSNRARHFGATPSAASRNRRRAQPRLRGVLRRSSYGGAPAVPRARRHQSTAAAIARPAATGLGSVSPRGSSSGAP